MKIGIITFHRAANYGAVLQGYALQQTIKKNNNNVEIIDYRCKRIEEMHAVLFLKIDSLKKTIKNIIRIPIRWNKRKKFNKFIKKKMILSSKKATTAQEFNLLVEEYDKVITGSDQVWNEKITNKDMVYFLQDISCCKKACYAPSFGFESLEGLTKEIMTNIADFEFLSLRERSTALELEKKTQKNVEIVLDPVFLIGIEEWEKFSKEPKEKEYILLYGIKEKKNLETIAMEYFKELKVPVISINDTLLRKGNVMYKRCPSPEEWVGLFKNATYVITDSFHGTAFSIIFQKKMIVKLGEYPQRIIDLLEKLNFKYQIEKGVVDLRDYSKWQKVNQTLQIEKSVSVNYLKKIQENTNEKNSNFYWGV